MSKIKNNLYFKIGGIVLIAFAVASYFAYRQRTVTPVSATAGSGATSARFERVFGATQVGRSSRPMLVADAGGMQSQTG